MVNTLYIKSKHTQILKTVFEVLKDILPETTIEFNKKNGIKIASIDPTQTILVYLKLDAKEFDEFMCKESKFTIGLNMDLFYKLIKSVKKDDTFSISIDEQKSDRLNIIMETNQGKTKNKQIDLMDLDVEKIDPPPENLEVRIIMKSSEFTTTCKEIGELGDKINIKCNKQHIIFSAKGNGAKSNIILNHQDDLVQIKFNKPHSKQYFVEGTFETKHLLMFSKCDGLSDTVEIYMKNNFALVIKYSIAPLGSILFWTTPIRPDDLDNDEISDSELYCDNMIKMK
jgi:proliferating cell nuclear antigen PCNA